jgi:hypothetical protein
MLWMGRVMLMEPRLPVGLAPQASLAKPSMTDPRSKAKAGAGARVSRSHSVSARFMSHPLLLQRGRSP